MKTLTFLAALIFGLSSASAQNTTPLLGDSFQVTRTGQFGQQIFPTITLAQVQTLFAATNAQVIAGTSTTTFVTPAGLTAWSGGGSGLGTMAQQNANNVAITGGTIIDVAETAVNSTSPTLLGPVFFGPGTTGNGTFLVYSIYPMPALAVDVTQLWNTVVVNGSSTGHPNEVLTFTGTPANAVQQFDVMVNNQDSVLHTITVPSSWSFNSGATTTSFKIQPSSYVFLTWDYDGTNYYLRGDPRTTSDLSTNSTPLPTDLVAVEPAATPGVVNKETASAIHIKSFTFSVNGNGVVLTTGLQTAFVKVPYAGTLIGYDMVVSPSGSCQVDIDGAASGSLPTTGNSIVGAGTKPTVTTAVDTSSTTLTSWTTAVTAGENFGINIVSATTVTSMTITLYYE